MGVRPFFLESPGGDSARFSRGWGWLTEQVTGIWEESQAVVGWQGMRGSVAGASPSQEVPTPEALCL